MGKDTTSMLQAAWMADLRRGSANEPVKPNPLIPPKDSIPAYIQQLDSALQTQDAPVANVAPKWYKNTIFVHVCMCLLVFLLTFVSVVVIRPPFLNQRKNDDDPIAAPKFLPINAVYMALVTTVLAIILMVVVAFVQNNNKSKSGKSNPNGTSQTPLKPSFFSFSRKQ